MGLVCNVETIILPKTITRIGVATFGGCSSLTSITIPDSVTSIGDGAFYGCSSLSSVTIPDSVSNIGYAFDGVFNIEYYGSATGSPWGAICVNCYVEGNFAYQDSTKTTLVACHPNATGSIIIPNSVTSIGDGAFYEHVSLTSITIPNSVTSIGDAAFSGCSSLTSITIPNSVTSIGEHAFRSCSSLTSVTIPDSVTSIGQSTF